MLGAVLRGRPMTAAHILAGMLDAYTQACSYRDTARVVTRYAYPPGSRGRPDDVQVFRTAFARPDRLRFESRFLLPNGTAFGHSLPWTRGDEVRAWRQTRFSTGRSRSLMSALGAGGLAALPVLGLLIPDRTPGSFLTDLVRAVPLDDEPLDGVACYRLRCRCVWWDREPTEEEREGVAFVERIGTEGLGLPPLGPIERLPLTLWIDKQTLLVRQIEKEDREEGRGKKVVTTSQPERDVPITEEELTFDPPAEEPV
jgi:hypothetical protein